MGSVNKVILVGNLGKDPVIRTIPSGAKVASFSLATTEVYKDKNGQKVQQTEWHNVVAWRNMAETAERFLKKGNPVYVEGKLRTRKWQDSDGKDRYTVEVNADVLVLIGPRQGDGLPAQESTDTGFDTGYSETLPPATSPDVPQGNEVADDLPF